MSATPMQVITRPFAIEPVTNIMLPDGIFDNALYGLRIACHYTNVSRSPLTNVSIYLESVGDPGIASVARTHRFASIPAGASVLVMWDADLEHATPGKRLVSFVAKADGFDSHRTIQQIFVSQTRFDSVTNSYTCTVEEGALTVSGIKAIVPRPTCEDEAGRECVSTSDAGPWVPIGMTMAWTPDPAFAGVHGELPFSDPWWKILAVVVLVIAAIVAVVAALKGAGKVSFSIGGTFDETSPSISCCKPKQSGGKGGYTVAGVASGIATAAAVVALADAADPIWRGQEATPPAAGELTISEKVVAKWSLAEAPNAGKGYPADVEWTYTRFTTGKTYEYSVKETPTNVHLLDGVQIETPSTVRPFAPLWVRARFDKGRGGLFKGSQLYAFAVFEAPGGLHFVVPMTDDGLGFDPSADDGVYAGSLDLEGAYRLLLEHRQDIHGFWRVYVFAQDVNQTRPGTPPEIAAQHIGGFFVASALHITFDPSLPCPLNAQGTIDVA